MEWVETHLIHGETCVKCFREVRGKHWMRYVNVPDTPLQARVYIHNECKLELEKPASKTLLTSRTKEEVEEKLEEILYKYGNAGYSGNEHGGYVYGAMLDILFWLLGKENPNYSYGWSPEWHRAYELKKGLRK